MKQSQREAVSKSYYKDYFSKAQKKKNPQDSKAPAVIGYLVRLFGA